jgi:hypothetical protein
MIGAVILRRRGAGAGRTLVLEAFTVKEESSYRV